MFTAGILLGIGLGGFVDGIVFHQILQTHSMLSARVPRTSVANLEINMFWDGIFHAAVWVLTAVGIALLWRAGAHRVVRWSGSGFVGALFVGWGLFNLVEGLIDHHVLHLHHVVEGNGVSLFDYAFLGSAIVFIVGGWLAVRSASQDQTDTNARS